MLPARHQSSGGGGGLRPGGRWFLGPCRSLAWLAFDVDRLFWLLRACAMRCCEKLHGVGWSRVAGCEACCRSCPPVQARFAGMNLLLYFPSAGLAPRHLSGNGRRRKSRSEWGGGEKSGSPAARLGACRSGFSRDARDPSRWEVTAVAAEAAPTFNQSSPALRSSLFALRLSLPASRSHLLALRPSPFAFAFASAFRSAAIDREALRRDAC